MPRSPAILCSQPTIGMQLFDYDTGAASATDFNLVGPGQGGNYIDLLALDPRVTNTHNSDFSVNINRHNMLPNPDFIIGAGTTGITGSSTGTVPLYYGAYNPGATESCAFSYNSSAGCPVGNGGAWQLVYTTNTHLKGLYVGSGTGYYGFKLKANTSYVLSVYVSTTLNVSGDYSGQWGLNFDAGAPTYTINNNAGTASQQYYTSDTSWYWINFIITVGATDYTGNVYLYNQYNPAGTSQTCYIGAIKLEEGQVASGWTGAVYETGTTDFKLPHANKNIDNVADGSSYGRVLGTELQGGVGGAGTVKQINDGANTFTATTVAAGLTATGQVRVANAFGFLPYLNTSSIITSVIDSSSRLLTAPWAAGVVLNIDGSLSGFTSGGKASSQVWIFSTGSVFTCRGQVKLAATGNDINMLIGNTTNGYGIRWKGSTGVVGIVKYVASAVTVVSAVTTMAQDTNLHSFEFTVTVLGASSNKLEATWDSVQTTLPLPIDTALNLATGTWNATFYDANSGTTKFWNLYIDSNLGTYSKMPAAVINTIDPAGLLKVANSTGTLPRTNTDSSITGAIDSSSNLLNNPFGNSSGVVYSNSDFSLTGFSATTIGTASIPIIPPSQVFTMSCDILSGSAAGPISIGYGTTTAGYFASATVSGSILTFTVKRYSGGSGATLFTGPPLSVASLTSQTIRIRLAIDFGQQLIEACLDTYAGGILVSYISAQSDGGGFLSFSPTTYAINAGGTTGKVYNLKVGHRELYLGNSIFYQNIITNSGTLANNVVTSSSIVALAVNTASIANNAVTGAKIAANTIGADNVNGMTGSGAVSLDNVPDGTTYKRVAATDVNSSNHLYTPWTNAAIYRSTGGSYQNLPAVVVSSSIAYPIVASFPITFAGWYQAGSTSSNIFWLIGNETNGLGIKWTSAGAFSLVTWKATVATVGTTIATVTRDTNWHWFSVKLTPGATPGTTDAYTLYLDTNTSTGTTGTTAVTWSSTAVVSFQGPSGGALINDRVSSNNP